VRTASAYMLLKQASVSTPGKLGPRLAVRAGAISHGLVPRALQLEYTPTNFRREQAKASHIQKRFLAVFRSGHSYNIHALQKAVEG